MSELIVNYQQQININESPIITSSKIAQQIFRDQIGDRIEFVEHFYLMLLNRANRVKGVLPISIGGIDGTFVDRRVILAIALKTLSVGIMICHNHPSGNLTPSEADIKLTNLLKEGCDVIGIKLLDHIILTKEDYYSFADKDFLY